MNRTRGEAERGTDAATADGTDAGTADGTGDGTADRTAVGAVADAGPSWSWYLVRVSGLFLAVLLPLHFAVVILRDDVGRTTLATVTARFADSRWQAVELVTLLLALLHGFLALRGAVLRAPRLTPGVAMRVVVLLGVAAALLAISLVWAMLSLS